MSTGLAALEPLSVDPLVRATPPAALALGEMATELHFVRSHFRPPRVETATWQLEVGGAVGRPRSWSLAELREFPARTQTVVLECAGHRRNELVPVTSGLQWGVGAVSEARWTGVPLTAVLDVVAPTAHAREVVFVGADQGRHRSSSTEVAFARALPLERARAGDILLAWEMNGTPIPLQHGAPLRAIVPGSYGVASVKWLQRIELVEEPFGGPFQSIDYQIDGEPLSRLRVSSLILTPQAGDPATGPVEVSGVAWGGEGGVAHVDVRVDHSRWQPATLHRPFDPDALTRWTITLTLPAGEHLLEARAHDRAGHSQPEAPEWNELGYGNNSIHRITIGQKRG